MKKQILSTAVLAITALTSCHTAGSSTTAAPATVSSTFNISFNGKSFHLTTPTTGTSIVALTTSSSSSAQWGASILCTDSHVQCNIGGSKFTGLGSAIGTYKGGCGGGVTLSTLSVTDYDDGHKMYETDCSGHDTTSTVTVTISNATECKGTFNVILTYNGNYYPATGDFDYKH